MENFSNFYSVVLKSNVHAFFNIHIHFLIRIDKSNGKVFFNFDYFTFYSLDLEFSFSQVQDIFEIFENTCWANFKLKHKIFMRTRVEMGDMCRVYSVLDVP